MGFVAYHRVSTEKQGRFGLGLEAQKELVQAHLARTGGEFMEEFVEVESGAKADRPVLQEAIRKAKSCGATLLIAKLDRLSRSVHFISGLMESGVRFVACDMPEANELTVHIMAAFAEHERKRISERTKAALAAAKARGTKLGNPNLKANHEAQKEAADKRAEKVMTVVGPLLRPLLRAKWTRRQIVDRLNDLGVETPRGGQWHLQTLGRVITRNRLLAAGTSS